MTNLKLIFNPITGNLQFINDSSSGGVPGGSNGELQFNDNGSFGGITGATYDSGSNRIAFSPEIGGTGILAHYMVAGIYTPGDYGQYASEVWVQDVNPPYDNAFRVKDISGGGSGVDTFTIGRIGDVVSLSTVTTTGVITSVITNSSNSSKIDVINGTLTDSSNTTSLSWESRTVLDAGQNEAMDWANRIFVTSGGATVMNWESGFTYDLTGTLSINSDSRHLIALDGSTVILDWSNSTTLGAYYFSSGKLIGDGSGLTGITAGAAGSNTDVQYNSSGSLAGDSNFTYDGAGNSFLSNQLQVPFIQSPTNGHGIVMTTALLIDSSGTVASVDWQNRILRTTGGDFAVTWDARQSYGSNGNTDLSIDWADRKLYYWNSTTPSLTIDWGACKLLDLSGTLSLDWNAHALFDSGGVIQSLDWINRNTLDGAGLRSTDWSTRYLYTSDGSTIIMDWSNITTAGSYNFVSGVLTTSSGFDSSISGNISIAGTTGKTFVWATNASAPTPQTLLALPLNVYGQGTINQVLGTPDAWSLVSVNGTDYKLPLYL